MSNPFRLDRTKDAELLIEVYGVLRKSIPQYFKALNYVIKYTRNKNLTMELEFNDINDLGVDLSKDEWLKIIRKIEFRHPEYGIETLHRSKISEFIKAHPNIISEMVLFRAEITPGIHDYIFRHITESISVSCYMLRMVELTPWVSPPWFSFNGIVFKHGEDIAIFLKNSPHLHSDILTALQESRKKAILTMDKIRGKIYNLQSESNIEHLKLSS